MHTPSYSSELFDVALRAACFTCAEWTWLVVQSAPISERVRRFMMLQVRAALHELLNHCIADVDCYNSSLPPLACWQLFNRLDGIRLFQALVTLIASDRSEIHCCAKCMCDSPILRQALGSSLQPVELFLEPWLNHIGPASSREKSRNAHRAREATRRCRSWRAARDARPSAAQIRSP